MNDKNIQRRIASTISPILVLCLFLLVAALPVSAGVALKLYYDPISGTAVSNLTSASIFPSSPTSYEVLTTGLVESVNVGDSFGAWTRGFIEAPQTGQYTFWLASDNDAELWLSTSDDPVAKVKIAENVGFVGFGQYTVKPAQKSAPVSLVVGQKYYFEMLHKEDIGGDHCEVAWSLPGGTYENILQPQHLWPFPVDLNDPSYPAITKAPSLLTSYQGVPVMSLPGPTNVMENTPMDLSVTIEATQPAYVQWFSNGVAIANANLATYHIPSVGLNQDGTVYSVTVTNSLGQDTASTTVSVSADTTPPTLMDVLNLGNPGGTIAVVFSEPINSTTGTNLANYAIDNGATITSARMGASSDTVLLRVAGISVGTVYNISVSNVQDLAATPNVIAAGSSLPLEQNLNSWFKFDESSGITASDSSGNSHDGSLVNGIAPGYAGKILRAPKFNGIDGHVRLQNAYDDFTSGMTIALWAYPTTDSSASWARFVDFGNGPANENILLARNGTSSTLTFEVYQGNVSAGKASTPDGTLVLNQWQHLVATMDSSGNVTLYKNGVLVGTGNTGVPNVVTRTNNFIGRSNWDPDAYYAGSMDDVRIYNRALSPAAVKALAVGGGIDDVDPSTAFVSMSATSAIAVEGGTNGVFTVTRTGSTNNSITVAYAMSGTASNGVDYATLSGNVVISAGATNAQVVVTATTGILAASRTAVLTLTGGIGYTINPNANADTVTILANNDVTPPSPTVVLANSYTTANSKIDVWFSEQVSSSATNLANFSLNTPSLNITNAVINARSLRVQLSVSGLVPTNAVLNITGVKDLAGNSGSYSVPVLPRLIPLNVVATVYHASNVRSTDFNAVNDGVVNNTANNNGASGFDTFNGPGNFNFNHFAGMIYNNPQDIRAIKVDLGQQFFDGGDWATQPNVYILIHPYDSNMQAPETDPADWVQVPAQLVSGGTFQSTTDPNPSPNTPIVFNLSSVPANQRIGYGWAVGGVHPNGGTGFLSLSELRGYGVPIANTSEPVTITQQPQSITVTQGQTATFTAKVNGAFSFPYRWQRNGSNIATGTSPTWRDPITLTTSPTTVADNGAQFQLFVTGANGTVTSQVATLTVLARTNPPSVTSATIDLFGNINVWFDEAADTGSATTIGNYALNDPALTITGASQDAYQLRTVLTVSGTPSVSNLTITVSGVQDLSARTMVTQTNVLTPLSWPVANVVANQYQQGRAGSLIVATNGVVNHSNANGEFFTTFGDNLGLSDFVGLTYTQSQLFNTIKLDLAWQFVDGMSWAAQPYVYILKNPVDTNQRPPENDPTNWVAVPATLISGSVFDIPVDAATGTPPVNSPIAFDLSRLPAEYRTGFGWAVGGVPGDGAVQFVDMAELQSFGVPLGSVTLGTPTIALGVTGPNIVINWPGWAVDYNLQSSPQLGAGTSWTPVGATRLALPNGQYSVTVPSPNSTVFYRLIR